ncbi:MAG TPA: nitrite reductase small subunit NirD [Burkholderiales bacterium]|nr:nitrite reductase small subunit NirD [Burkholderiales bacterium]
MDGWKKICRVEDIPRLGARVVRREGGDIAVFRNADDEVFALDDKCPHKGGPLSQGIVHGKHVTCPLHAWKICLGDGNAVAPDEGCTKRYAVKIKDEDVLLQI